MPNKIVTVRRWELIAAFALPFVVAFSVAVYNSIQISRAEDRITANARAIDAGIVRNAAQDEVRKQLVEGLREADHRACARINQLKRQNRKDALEDFARLDETLSLIGIPPSPAILKRAKDDLERTLKNNKAEDC